MFVRPPIIMATVTRTELVKKRQGRQGTSQEQADIQAGPCSATCSRAEKTVPGSGSGHLLCF